MYSVVTPEQINAVVTEIRERVRDRHQKKLPEIPDFELPSLDPLGHARDAAEGKAAAIGRVNPRPPGLLNNAVQSAKRGIARLLNWLVRDQVDFNQAVLRYFDTNIEASIEQNYNILRVGRTVADLENRHAELRQQTDDMLRHWKQWRPAWEEKLTKNEIDLLHSIRGIEERAREREAAQGREALKMHQDYLDALKQSIEETQNRFWDDLAKLKSEQEQLIHSELRLIRRRAAATEAPPTTAGPSTEAVTPSTPTGSNGAPPAHSLDYARFEERFRGDEAYVRDAQKFFLPYFKDCRRAVDLGCGRGEFLELLREAGVSGVGVDLDPDAVAACREKKLEVEATDLFEFLDRQAEASFDGAFCAHTVEHLKPESLPGMIRLLAEKLAPGGVVAIETPNPGCLAIFAGDFYLDPSHQRPVPSQQLDFYLQEAGFGEIEVHERHPAADVFPEIASLDRLEELRGFRRKFFGGLDYAIIARKLKS